MESSETWRTEALKSFAISKSGMQGGEAKRNLPWSILDDSHYQPLLEYFLELNLCMLYVFSKLEKSAIQCFKWCTIQSWNEGVTAIRIRSLQAEGKFRTAAKSALGCENGVLLLQNFAALLLWNFSWSFPRFATDILRFFALDIWCLNPHSLLVTHQS